MLKAKAVLYRHHSEHLLCLPEDQRSVSRYEADQPRHWQDLFAKVEVRAQQKIQDLVADALEDGAGFEIDCDLQVDRDHKRCIRLTGSPVGFDGGVSRRSLDIVIQDITQKSARNVADGVNRMLDTTLGLRRRDRIMQSFILAVGEAGSGSVLLIRLQGLANSTVGMDIRVAVMCCENLRIHWKRVCAVTR